MGQHQLYAVKSKPIIHITDSQQEWLKNTFGQSIDAEGGLFYLTKKDFDKAVEALPDEKRNEWRFFLRGIRYYLRKENSSVDLAIWS